MSINLYDFQNKKVHFIGIGGVSMSGLAEILLNRGFNVSGSDMKESPITESLKAKGADVIIGHSAENISSEIGIVVYTAAISEDNPELIAAKNSNALLFRRDSFLGLIMKDFKHNIAVAGTHGKTTTTSMVSHIIIEGNLDPTILVGGRLDIINGYVRTGKSDYFITEACEYKASFLSFFPTIGIILNIDADHLDYYKDITEIEETFKKFIDIIPKDGYIIGNAEDEKVMKLLSNVSCNSITFGVDTGDLQARNLKFNSSGCGVFDVYQNETKLFQLELKVPGKHNVLNSLSAIASALILNVSHDAIIRGIESFKGTHRRFEFKGEVNGISVIDDYAHHPTEIKATLEASKNYPHKRIICVFQPHTYTRTSTLFDEFANSFFNLDKLVLCDIYAAREKDTGIVSSDMLGDAVRKLNVDAVNIHSFEEIVDYLRGELKEGDLLLTVGAGDVHKVGEMLLDSFK